MDLKLVALWLSSLTPDERSRFHVLRDRFAKEQVGRRAIRQRAVGA